MSDELLLCQTPFSKGASDYSGVLFFSYRFTLESNIYTHKKLTVKKQPDFLDFSNFAVKSKT